MGTAIQLFLHLPSIYLPGLRSSEGNTRNPARPRRLHRNFICKFIAVICGVSIDPNLNPIHASIFQYFEKNTFTNLSTQSIRIHFQNTIIPSYAFATLIQIFGRYFTKLYEDGAHAKNLRRESGYISVSRHYPPPAIRIQRRRNVHPRRDYKIALPPPREIFNLVYYRPATLPSRPQTLSPLFRPRKLLHESLPSSQGWRRMEKPPFSCEEKNLPFLRGV